MDNLGLTIHPEKSVFLPTRKIEFLGFLLDSEKMTVSITHEKADKIVTLCNKLLSKCEISIREFAQVIAKLVASQPGVQFAPLFFKDLEHEKEEALRIAKGNYDSKITLSKTASDFLLWWIDNLHISYNPIKQPEPDMILESDSSGSGWGDQKVIKRIEQGDIGPMLKNKIISTILNLWQIF